MSQLNGPDEIADQRGTYILVLEAIEKFQIRIKQLKWTFQPGLLLYFGSAKGLTSNSLRNRVKRHFTTKKKNFWHIDYLTTHSAIVLHRAYLNLDERSTECQNLAAFSKDVEIAILSNFGSSDCKNKCGGHLVYLTSKYLNLKWLDDYFGEREWLKITEGT